MNWEALGAIAELLGAVAVIVTLLYLSLQIRQASRATDANTELSFTAMYGSFNSRLSANPDLARVVVCAMEQQRQLEDFEIMQFRSWLTEYVGLIYAEWTLSQKGISEPEYAQHNLRTLKDMAEIPMVRRILDEILNVKEIRNIVLGEGDT